jgi:hypothetical protein
MASVALAEDRAGFHLEGGEKRGGPVAAVVVRLASRATARRHASACAILGRSRPLLQGLALRRRHGGLSLFSLLRAQDTSRGGGILIARAIL